MNSEKHKSQIANNAREMLILNKSNQNVLLLKYCATKNCKSICVAQGVAAYIESFSED